MKRHTIVTLIVVFSTSAGQASDLCFPIDKWESVAAADAGWDPKGLELALQFAMARRSSSVVILQRGRILAEQHRDLNNKSARYAAMVHGRTSDGHAIEDVASVQKSVVSLLVGIAQEKQFVQIDDPVSEHLEFGWSQATREQESKVTIRHLISMSSGLDERLRFVAAPGAKWKYNTSAYALSRRAIATASGKSANELTSLWLTDPIGMEDSRWVERTYSRGINRYGFATSARDLARFGLLILAKGKWRGQTILSDQGYLKEALSPSQPMNPSYGYLWWLNGQASILRSSGKVAGPLIATAPKDLVAAFGALGRKCYVVPSLNLVVTRLGDSPEVRGQPRFDVEFWRLLMLAAPK